MERDYEKEEFCCGLPKSDGTFRKRKFCIVRFSYSGSNLVICQEENEKDFSGKG